jgi:hypothetical protein
MTLPEPLWPIGNITFAPPVGGSEECIWLGLPFVISESAAPRKRGTSLGRIESFATHADSRCFHIDFLASTNFEVSIAPPDRKRLVSRSVSGTSQSDPKVRGNQNRHLYTRILILKVPNLHAL